MGNETTYRIVLEESVPLREPEAQVHFTLDMLYRVRDCHAVQGNPILFKCNTCRNRFVTRHLNHKPAFELDECNVYLNAVREWDEMPVKDGSRAAALAIGLCERCALSATKVENDEALQGVATFSSENMMKLLWGCDSDAALLKKFD